MTDHATDVPAPSRAALAPELLLGEPVTDATHEEFVQLLDAAARAADDGFLAALDEWIEHTRHHFGQEETWMEAMNFGPQHCHRGEHQQVLAVADAVRVKVAEGDVTLGRRLVSELPGWFDQHVRSMDAMMVGYMREHGFTLIEAPDGQAA
ncbi:bacteriohemerythrin [Cupriavidus basilensis]|uniref:bacteriohemerythrin n=1 Tax=Cupriavidus basilensis TaxID=68895 RepID=UPI0007515783|nr:bacteriohemerythrin [Cupriavidus basilensis]